MTKVYGILGDIHANLDALNVVREDAVSQGVTDWICTGDVVGYNACPSECIRIVRDGLKAPVVCGNHDYYVAYEQNLADFHPAAAQAVLVASRAGSETRSAGASSARTRRGRIGLVTAQNWRPRSVMNVAHEEMLPVSMFPVAIPESFIGNWTWPLATLSHWRHLSLRGVFTQSILPDSPTERKPSRTLFRRGGWADEKSDCGL